MEDSLTFTNRTVGADESGRGPCFGRVYAATVIIPDTLNLPKHVVIRDSKTMTEKQRKEASEWIRENCIWAIGKMSRVLYNDVYRMGR